MIGTSLNFRTNDLSPATDHHLQAFSRPKFRFAEKNDVLALLLGCGIYWRGNGVVAAMMKSSADYIRFRCGRTNTELSGENSMTKRRNNNSDRWKIKRIKKMYVKNGILYGQFV